jgi:putative membrane protein
MTIRNFTDHAANERTFLAWVRTALAVVAFGFLVERFDLFLSYMARATPHASRLPPPHYALGNVAGMTLIVLGVLMIAVAAWRFVATARDIERKEIVADSGDRIDLAFGALLVLLSGGILFYLAQALAQQA